MQYLSKISQISIPHLSSLLFEPLLAFYHNIAENNTKTEADLVEKLQKKLSSLNQPKRIALSLQYPKLQRPFILSHRAFAHTQNHLFYNIARKNSANFYKNVVFRHQSLLMKKLGESDPRLQKQKIVNLKIAAEKLNGLIIKPGQIFSLWHTIGKPSSKRGFVNGMLLSNGKVIEGVGGGLCQMANLLYWMFLHTQVQVKERYHHSKDVFPDSGRTLPFGSGATILYNYIDLKIKNTTDKPLQLKIWVTDKHLKGQLLSNERIPQKYHVKEKNHFFIKKGNQYFRYNEIWRDERINGITVKEEKITENFAPVLYRVTNEYVQKNDFNVIKM